MDSWEAPLGWREAKRASNLRYLNRGGWFNSSVLRACLSPGECPMSRRGKECIASICIGRYPEESDLFEYVK